MTVLNNMLLMVMIIHRGKNISKKAGVKGIWVVPERKPFFVMSFLRSLLFLLLLFGRLG